MFGLFGTAAKKTAQALDIIEEDQPTVEEIAEAAEILNEQPPALMQLPQKVGLVEPIIIDPQVIFERLTELFGVYKGTTKVYNMDCNDCGHEWETASAPSDWEDCIECPHCEQEQEFSEAYSYTSAVQLTSRTPTCDELLLVDTGNYTWTYTHGAALDSMKNLFIALSGNTVVDSDGDEWDLDLEKLLYKYRNIESLSSERQFPNTLEVDDDDI